MFLLDTHTFLWFLSDDPKLPSRAREIIEATQDIQVSIGTFWEIAIKASLGKLVLPASVSTLMNDCRELGFIILPIKASHLELLRDLPQIHRDPFDRLFICQAKVEDLTIITADTNISRYDIHTFWDKRLL